MFFTQISQLMNREADITLVIRKNEGQLTVSVLPKSSGLKDEAQNHIVPLTVTGTPEELDTGFLPAICRPLQKVAGLLSNMCLFEQQADRAAADSKAQKELKTKEDKEAKARKEKFDKLVKTADGHIAERKYAEAVAGLQKAKEFATPPELKSVDGKIADAKDKMGQGSLFGMETMQQPQQQPVQQQPAQQSAPVQQPSPQQMPQQPYPGYPPMQNGQQQMFGNNASTEPVYPREQAPAQNHDSYTPGGYRGPEPIPYPEPEISVTGSYSAHREGEYDEYPDFPGYPGGDGTFNPQNR